MDNDLYARNVNITPYNNDSLKVTVTVYYDNWIPFTKNAIVVVSLYDNDGNLIQRKRIRINNIWWFSDKTGSTMFDDVDLGGVKRIVVAVREK